MCNFGQKTQELVILAKEGDDSALEQLCRVYGEAGTANNSASHGRGASLQAGLDGFGPGCLSFSLGGFMRLHV